MGDIVGSMDYLPHGSDVIVAADRRIWGAGGSSPLHPTNPWITPQIFRQVEQTGSSDLFSTSAISN